MSYEKATYIMFFHVHDYISSYILKLTTFFSNILTITPNVECIYAIFFLLFFNKAV